MQNRLVDLNSLTMNEIQQLLNNWRSQQIPDDDVARRSLRDQQMVMLNQAAERIRQTQVRNQNYQGWVDLNAKVELLLAKVTASNAELFMCNICMTLAYNPVYLKCCQNFICKFCLIRMTYHARASLKCPYCKMIYKSENFPKGLKDIFENIIVKCKECHIDIVYSLIVKHFEKECVPKNDEKKQIVNDLSGIRKSQLIDQQKIETRLIDKSHIILKCVLFVQKQENITLEGKLNSLKFCEHDCFGQVHEYKSKVKVLREFWINNQRIRLLLRYQECLNCKDDKEIKSKFQDLENLLTVQEKVDSHISILLKNIDIEFNQGSLNTKDNLFLSGISNYDDQVSFRKRYDEQISISNSFGMKDSQCIFCNKSFDSINPFFSFICEFCQLIYGFECFEKDQQNIVDDSLPSVLNIPIIFRKIQIFYFEKIAKFVPIQLEKMKWPHVEASIKNNVYCMHNFKHHNSKYCLNLEYFEDDYLANDLKNYQKLKQVNPTCYFSVQEKENQQNLQQSSYQVQCLLKKVSPNQDDRWICETCNLALCYFCAKQLSVDSEKYEIQAQKKILPKI
eukprot:403361444